MMNFAIYILKMCPNTAGEDCSTLFAVFEGKGEQEHGSDGGGCKRWQEEDAGEVLIADVRMVSGVEFEVESDGHC